MTSWQDTKAQLNDLNKWNPLIQQLAQQQGDIKAISFQTSQHSLTSDPTSNAYWARHQHDTYLNPLDDLAAEWATIRKEEHTATPPLQYLEQHIQWASNRSAFKDAQHLIDRAWRWVAQILGYTPHQTNLACPLCLVLNKSSYLVQYPTNEGYTRTYTCPTCQSIHTTFSLPETWKRIASESDAAMPAKWIRAYFGINPTTWRQWKHRGKIQEANDGSGLYPLPQIRELLAN